MKKQIFISLVSLTLTVAGATAATTAQNPENIVTLPTYQVDAARQTAAERDIEQSLNEFSAEAAKPLPVRYVPTLPSVRINRDIEGPSLAGSRTLKPISERT
jgi:hypothetical protein